MSQKPSTSTSKEEPFSSKITTEFDPAMVKEALKQTYENPKNKITEEALELVAELAKVLTIEASIRAAKQASLESKPTVTLDHVETILPQLMLDFP